MNRRYTKADPKKLFPFNWKILMQCDDMLSIMGHQNELLNSVNEKLKDEISKFKDKYAIYSTRRRNSKE